MPPVVLWEGIAVRAGTTGAPLLAEALGWLECRVSAEHDVGDHTFFVGEVVSLEESDAGPALVYRRHRYAPVD
jgi:flavin reductase (DIM6/NTAB) family NADH-FMN oxidoreductase RutF